MDDGLTEIIMEGAYELTNGWSMRQATCGEGLSILYVWSRKEERSIRQSQPTGKCTETYPNPPHPAALLRDPIHDDAD